MGLVVGCGSKSRGRRKRWHPVKSALIEASQSETENVGRQKCETQLIRITVCVCVLSEGCCVANVRDHAVFLPDLAVQPVYPSSPGLHHLLTGLCGCPDTYTGKSAGAAQADDVSVKEVNIFIGHNVMTHGSEMLVCRTQCENITTKWQVKYKF